MRIIIQKSPHKNSETCYEKCVTSIYFLPVQCYASA